MNLYLLKLESKEDLDPYFHYKECVVAANSSEEAKTIHPCKKYRWSGVNSEEPWETKKWDDWITNRDWNELTEPTYFERVDEWTNNIDNIKVTLLGKAEFNISKGLIISSYYSYG
jgi:hypothetical protein